MYVPEDGSASTPLTEAVAGRWGRSSGELAGEFKAAGVWQLQRRGSWHLHLFVDGFIDVIWLRSAALACGFGPQMRIDAIGGDHSCGRSDQPPYVGSLKKAVRYAVRYAVRDVETGEYAGETLFTYCGRTKPGNVKFHWSGGIRALWRRGCVEWAGMETGELVLDQPFFLLVRLGWDSLSDVEQFALYHRDDSVARWTHGPPGEGNSLEPF
jgi:hypothetical protein